MRVGRYEIILHWGSSFAIDFSNNWIHYVSLKQDGDTYLKLGRALLIVSDITKVKQLHRGVQKA